jgi:hypothetical protein
VPLHDFPQFLHVSWWVGVMAVSSCDGNTSQVRSHGKDVLGLSEHVATPTQVLAGSLCGHHRGTPNT